MQNRESVSACPRVGRVSLKGKRETVLSRGNSRGKELEERSPTEDSWEISQGLVLEIPLA